MGNKKVKVIINFEIPEGEEALFESHMQHCLFDYFDIEDRMIFEIKDWEIK